MSVLAFRCGCRLDAGRYPVGCDEHTEDQLQYVGVDERGHTHAVTAPVLTTASPIHVRRSALGGHL